MSNLVIADHAVDRFVERIAPGMSIRAARSKMEAASAVRTQDRTIGGEEIWQCAELRCRFIVRAGRMQDQHERVVITVYPLDGEIELPKSDLAEQQILSDERLIIRDLRRALSEMLRKYGWHGNEDARAIRDRARDFECREVGE